MLYDAGAGARGGVTVATPGAERLSMAYPSVAVLS